MKSIFLRIAVAALSVLVTLVVLEAGLRLFRPVGYLSPMEEVPASDKITLLVRSSPIPGAIYDLAPDIEKTVDGVTARTNHFGMRGHAPSENGNGSMIRIAAMGDSVTFGWAVEERESWPAVLETQLNGAPWDAALTNHFEVLNFAVPGYNTVQEAALLRYKALQWKPQLVIVGYVLNDPEITPIDPLRRSFLRPEWWQHSHLLRLIAKAKRDSDLKRLGKGDYYVYLHAEGHPAWASVAGGFENIRSAASQANAKVLVVIFPFFPIGKNDWAQYPYRRIHQQVAAQATQNGFDVLDLLAAYSNYKPSTVTLPASIVHPNALGYKLAASEIAAKVAEILARH